VPLWLLVVVKSAFLLFVVVTTFAYAMLAERKGQTSVTVSIGTRSRRTAMGLCAELLRAADGALYAAEQGGRNTIRCAGEDPSVYHGIAPGASA